MDGKIKLSLHTEFDKQNNSRLKIKRRKFRYSFSFWQEYRGKDWSFEAKR